MELPDLWNEFYSQHLMALCLQAEGTLAWVRMEDRYERMCRYLEKWWTGLDRRGGGLSVWRNAGHTGMDNHYERAGRDDASFCEGVDLNAYLVREADAMAIVAGALGKAQDQARFTEQARARARGMRDTMWDDADGIFYDHHALEDRPIKVKHVGIFAALWAGVATEAQAERLVREHLLNESEFWRPYPLPALSASEPGYVEGFLPGNKTGCCSWRAHTWMPTNYYAFQGLRRYGFLEEAQLLADRSWELFLRGRFSEYFTSETGIGTGRKSFGGWTGLVLFLHPELLLGLDPTGLEPDNRAIGAMRRWLIEQDA